MLRSLAYVICDYWYLDHLFILLESSLKYTKGQAGFSFLHAKKLKFRLPTGELIFAYVDLYETHN